MEIFAFWFHKNDAIKLIAGEFDCSNGTNMGKTTKTDSKFLRRWRRIVESVEVMGIQRGCCGIFLVLIILFGCIVANIIPNL